MTDDMTCWLTDGRTVVQRLKLTGHGSHGVGMAHAVSRLTWLGGHAGVGVGVGGGWNGGGGIRAEEEDDDD